MIALFPNGIEYDQACYWANHHFSMLLACGCTIGDAEYASAPGLAVAEAGRSAGPGGVGASDEYLHAFAEGYLAAGARLEAQADVDFSKGRSRSAGNKLLRASILYELLDWNYWPYGNVDKTQPGAYFRKGRAAFKRGLAAAGGRHAGIVWTTVKFEGQELEAMFVPARDDNGAIISDRKVPVVMHVNGQHSSLQWQYCFGLSAALAERGIASFHFDHPGTGKARYDQGMGARPDSESYGRAGIDYLVSRDDVDADRIGIIGGSFGSYRGPRIASFDDRVKSVVAWSTQYDLSVDFEDVTHRLMGDDTFGPDDQESLDMLYYWTATDTLEALRTKWRQWTLADRMQHVRAAIVCVRGDNDSMPQYMAEKTVNEAVNSPRAELVVTTASEGGTEHCHWDEPAYALAQMVDFTAEVLGGRNSSAI